jgi:hypothetical protein
MKKVFISQPMRGKTHADIERERDYALFCVRSIFGFGENDVELIDTFFKDFDGNRLEFLGKSIAEGLAKADVAVFVGDWHNYDGCRCEHFIAVQYKVPCFYVNRTDTEVSK